MHSKLLKSCNAQLKSYYLWVKKNFRTQKSFIAYINGEFLLGNGIDSSILFDPFGSVCVIFAELFYQVRADVTKAFL